MTWLLILCLAYVIGALPCHWWVCPYPLSHKKVLIYSQLPKKEALLLTVIDLVKGISATLLGFAVLGWVGAYLAALLVVAGSMYSCFLGFRGGTGLGVAAGALLILSPLFLLFGVLIYLLGLLLVRSLFAAALLTAVAIILFGIVFVTHMYVWGIVLVLGAVMLFRLCPRWFGTKKRWDRPYRFPPWKKRW
ncbi:glycerol-3-phosphate acyltransferase [Laceyella putida]|uniref:Glycerol-3-phosphate acyltransferase n=1 Tax=Laceyella putida TaxID=110101 RepID=A0ABW2RLH4_9BACL